MKVTLLVFFLLAATAPATEPSKSAASKDFADCLIESFDKLKRQPYRELQLVRPYFHRYVLVPPGGAVSIDDARALFRNPAVLNGCAARAMNVARREVDVASGKTVRVLVDIAPFRRELARVVSHVFDNTCARIVTEPLVVGSADAYVSTTYISWELQPYAIPAPLRALLGVLRHAAVYRWILPPVPTSLRVPVVRWRRDVTEEPSAPPSETCAYVATQLVHRLPIYDEFQRTVVDAGVRWFSESLGQFYVDVNGTSVLFVPTDERRG